MTYFLQFDNTNLNKIVQNIILKFLKIFLKTFSKNIPRKFFKK